MCALSRNSSYRNRRLFNAHKTFEVNIFMFPCCSCISTLYQLEMIERKIAMHLFFIMKNAKFSFSCHTLKHWVNTSYTLKYTQIYFFVIAYVFASALSPSSISFLIFFLRIDTLFFNPLLHRIAVPSPLLLSTWLFSSWSTRIRIPGNNIPTPSRPCFT